MSSPKQRRVTVRELLTSPSAASLRKRIEASTGVLLLLFLLEHAAGNALSVLPDPTYYDGYVELLGRTIVVRVLEVCLFLVFGVHIVIGLAMKYVRRVMIKRRPVKPAPQRPILRVVGWTGGVIIIFLGIHLTTFFVPDRFGLENLHPRVRMAEAFSHFPYVLFYVVSMFAVSLHLYYGISSALATLPLVPRSWIPGLIRFGRVSSIVAPILLALTAVIFFIRS